MTLEWQNWLKYPVGLIRENYEHVVVFRGVIVSVDKSSFENWPQYLNLMSIFLRKSTFRLRVWCPLLVKIRPVALLLMLTVKHGTLFVTTML